MISLLLSIKAAQWGMQAMPATELQRGDSGITYGIGVYWAKVAASQFPGQVEIVDLRSLFPIDDDLVFTTVKQHGKCIVLSGNTQIVHSLKHCQDVYPGNVFSGRIWRQRLLDI